VLDYNNMILDQCQHLFSLFFIFFVNFQNHCILAIYRPVNSAGLHNCSLFVSVL